MDQVLISTMRAHGVGVPEAEVEADELRAAQPPEIREVGQLARG